MGTIATKANLQCLSSGSSTVAYVAGGCTLLGCTERNFVTTFLSVVSVIKYFSVNLSVSLLTC